MSRSSKLLPLRPIRAVTKTKLCGNKRHPAKKNRADAAPRPLNPAEPLASPSRPLDHLNSQNQRLLRPAVPSHPSGLTALRLPCGQPSAIDAALRFAALGSVVNPIRRFQNPCLISVSQCPISGLKTPAPPPCSPVINSKSPSQIFHPQSFTSTSVLPPRTRPRPSGKQPSASSVPPPDAH